jgi:hypothetical protein
LRGLTCTPFIVAWALSLHKAGRCRTLSKKALPRLTPRRCIGRRCPGPRCLARLGGCPAPRRSLAAPSGARLSRLSLTCASCPSCARWCVPTTDHHQRSSIDSADFQARSISNVFEGRGGRGGVRDCRPTRLPGWRVAAVKEPAFYTRSARQPRARW